MRDAEYLCTALRIPALVQSNVIATLLHPRLFQPDIFLANSGEHPLLTGEKWLIEDTVSPPITGMQCHRDGRRSRGANFTEGG